ncbi:MAG TPA: IclR family transcriptional regulator [Ramlibacter sp.]|nr:IclR family transcriptional regulator [Ramlibacter sp.]
MNVRFTHRGGAAHATDDAGTGNVLTVQRGMEVLRAFRSERLPLSNAELVRRTGLPKATVSRLTSTLMERGFLRHVAGGREFELSTGPLSIGHAYIEASPLLKLAHPFMQEFADRQNASVALAIPHGLEMLYVGYRISRQIATLRLGVGSLLPMGVTAIGRAYLWALPPAQQKVQLAALRRAAGSQGATLEQGIRAAFADLESTGTCFAVGGYQRDAFGIALPVRIGRQQTLMALSCGSVEVEEKLEATRHRIAPALRKAAPQLEKLLAEVEEQP